MEGRTEIAETRLAVTATQIVERLRMRATHLQELLEEELDIDTRILQLENSTPGDFMGLESALAQQSSRISSDRRRESTECWRDVAHVMRDFLNAWEGFSRNEAKNRFLAALPQTNTGNPNNGNLSAQQSPYHNDNYNHHYRIN